MKKIKFILLFFVCGILYGQENLETKHSMRLGVNRAYFTSGDIGGTVIYGEYAYSFNDYLAITPKIMSGYAHKTSEQNFQNISSFATSLSLRITPLPNSFKRLKVDVGGVYHRMIISSKQNYLLIDKPLYTYSENSERNLFGLISSIHVNVIDTKKIETGVRVDMLTSFDEGSLNADAWQTGLYFGVKF